MDALTREELLDLAYKYSDYVIEYNETHEEGNYPICIMEFYDCEYQN